MDEEEIRALEPKFIGNTRHLTEGEAAEIVRESEFRDEIDDLGERPSAAMLPAALVLNRGVENGGFRP